MREMKFRAWNKKENKWAKIDLDDWDNAEMSATIGYGNKKYPYMTFRVESDDYYEFMQYTGLKDKNGKDIYEGDIIKYEFICLGGTDIIIFRDGKFELKNSFIESEGYRSVKNISENCEIIGNIYQNKDLIK